MADRYVAASKKSGRKELKQLIGGIIATELVSPSEEFWLVSPWISNVPVLEDTAGRFRQINFAGGERLDLVPFLTFLLEAGTEVTVVTLSNPKNESAVFLRELEASCKGTPFDANLRIQLKEDLHAKGLLSDGCAIIGSMNWTYRGINVNDELVHYTATQENVASLKQEFWSEYGDWSS